MNQGTILIVDNDKLNRSHVCEMLRDKYALLEADDVSGAEKILDEYREEVVAFVINLDAAIMRDYEFSKKISKDARYSNVPVMILTNREIDDEVIRALDFGIWDYANMPISTAKFRFRLRNVIERSHMVAFEKLKYMTEFDTLTGIYNKRKLFQEAGKRIENSDAVEFTFIRLDIVHFKLINSYFGVKEGDNILKYIARILGNIAEEYGCLYGRLESDVFGLFFEYRCDKINEIIRMVRDALVQYNSEYSILPCVGVYYFRNRKLSMDVVLDRATLAAKSCRGSYVKTYAIYTDNMSADIQQEQEIVNNMRQALQEEQFCVYFQPKYDINTNLPAGAEALVRWEHPEIGMITPDIFIPVFERNGFISQLDYFVWEKVCIYLREWMNQGLNVLPVSVNVSRVDLYNPRLVDNICDLVDKYNIPKSLFNLELTESAYTDNPQMMIDTMERFQSKGFTIMMDDFGSGYSSLNVLKDMKVDVLKIDMKFMEKTRFTGRGENIIASVVRMAKWLKMPVIAEGVETANQVRFLRSIGCEFVQGYYFAKPMKMKDYTEILRTNKEYRIEAGEMDDFDADSIWQMDSEIDRMFNSIMEPTGIYEYQDGEIELIRANESFCNLLGKVKMNNDIPANMVDDESKDKLNERFRMAIESREMTVCEDVKFNFQNESKLVSFQLNYINKVGKKNIVLGIITDISDC